MHSCGIPRWLLSRPPRWLKRLPSTAAACRATVSPLHDHRIVLAAPLCYTVALPRRSAVPLPLLSHCSSAPLSYGSTTAASLLPRRRAAPRLPRLLPHRVAPLRPRRSAAFLYPPTALLLPRRSSTLPRCSAPRRSASLCYMLPALHRAASLLPRCFAAAAPLRYCHSTARPLLLNQSLLGLEHSKTCLQTGLRKATQACFPSGNRCRPCGFHRDLRGRTVFRCLHFLSCSPFFLCSPLLSSPPPSSPLLPYPLLSCLLLSSPLSCLESKTTLCFVSFGWLLAELQPPQQHSSRQHAMARASEQWVNGGQKAISPRETWHIAGERPEKRQRLTSNDCESKVLGSGDYSEVLPHNEVPFVNRHSELFDLFHVNAAVSLKLLDCRRKEVSIDDWRPCSVAVAAQMFGSGKTTLGRNFIKQLQAFFYCDRVPSHSNPADAPSRGAVLLEGEPGPNVRPVFLRKCLSVACHVLAEAAKRGHPSSPQRENQNYEVTTLPQSARP